MTSVMIYQRIWGTGRLLNFNLNHKVLHSLSSTNIRNLNSLRKEPILKIKSFYMGRRNFYKLFNLFKKPSQRKLKIKDDVPDQYNLIYRSTMDRYLFYAQIITNATALILIIGALYNYDAPNYQLDFSQWDWKNKPLETENEVIIYIAAFVTFIAILQIIVTRLPIRIYNLPQQKKYIFIFHGNYPFTQRKLTCKVGDVIHIPDIGVMPWKEEKYLIKNQQKIILLDQYFRRPADLYIMLGVQKDPDVDE